MKRTFSGFLMGIPITFMLFVLMSMLIEPIAANPPIVTREVPDLGPDRLEEEVPIIPRPEIPELETVAERPKTSRISSEVDDEIDPLPRHTETIEFPPSGPGTLKTPYRGPNNIAGAVDQEAVAVLISEPRWPKNAQTGGSVRLCFAIMPDGRPSNVVVVDSNPGKVFVKSAKRAVYKWKFRPSYVNGQAIEQENMCYTMEFVLEE